MRATTTPASVAAAALALTLVPAAAATTTAAAAAQETAAEPVVVRLKVADQPARDVASTPRTWPRRLLTTYAIPVDGDDLVRVRRDGRRVKGTKRRLREGDVVRVVEVDKERATKRKRVRARTVEVHTTRLAPGRRKVVRRGKPGVRKVVALRTFHNGEPVKYRVIKRKLVRDPRPRRVLVGRKPYFVPGTGGLNWGALAGCESGGNPRAVNPAGYYGLYQFNVSTWRSVGGSGLPSRASAAEQTYRAKLLYKQRGRSPWPHCGRLL